MLYILKEEGLHLGCTYLRVNQVESSPDFSASKTIPGKNCKYAHWGKSAWGEGRYLAQSAIKAEFSKIIQWKS